MEPHAGSRHLEILLLHELSSGTFARLYLAEARAPGGIERIVAVKILREQWNDSAEIINRTRDEARLLARLRHRNILRVEDLSEIDGQLAIIMEFVDGLDLKQLVEGLAKRRQRVPARVALQIAAEAGSALEAAYFKVPYGLDAPLHVVHRDIKPSNVMVSVEGELKVLDFGTARSSQAFRSVQTGALRFGSLKYMSPERREGDRGEHSCDVYALGLMLLEILKGAWLPLLPMDLAEHDEAVTEEVTRLDNLGMPNREWDIALRQVLLQMLAGEASLRPNAEQVAKLLRAFAEQASGETLDTFAHDTLAPLASQMRGNLKGGALAGTKFVVNWFPSDGSSRGGTPPSPQPTAAPAAPPPPEPVEDDEDPPTQAGYPAGVRAQSPLHAASARPESPAPPADPRPPIDPRPQADPGWSGRATPEVEVSVAASRRSRSALDDAPPTAGTGNGMMIAAGGAVVLFALLCAGTLGAGVLWGYMQTSRVATPTVVSAPSVDDAGTAVGAGGSPAAAVGPAAAANAPVDVQMEGAPVQWIRLHTVLGQPVVSGQDRLAEHVAPDTYDLSLKQVGRPALKGRVSIPIEGISLVCSPAKDATVACVGAAGTVVLAQ